MPLTVKKQRIYTAICISMAAAVQILNTLSSPVTASDEASLLGLLTLMAIPNCRHSFEVLLFFWIVVHVPFGHFRRLPG